MPGTPDSLLARLPAVDQLLRGPAAAPLQFRYGRKALVEAIRRALDEARTSLKQAGTRLPDDEALMARCAALLAAGARSSLEPVFNLTGTVLHTNLGRAPLPKDALAALAPACAGACNLEYDLEQGARGERDSHVEGLLCELTGAEAACVVNNNAAALLLVLNTLALRKRVLVSRGELVEIGGSFRLPELMARAGCTLVEVGTTNRTHARDYEQAITPRAALLLKVHPSNYAIEGFVAQVREVELAAIAHGHGLPFAVDLGSGALLPLERYGLPHEPTVREALCAGADLVTFSGDKLLGGPQAGLVCGRRDLVERLRRNPLRRALRVGRLTLAVLESVLRLYRDPDALASTLPALRLLTRRAEDIEALGQRLLPIMQACLPAWRVSLESCASQVGSGAQPGETLPSFCLAVRGAGLTGLARRLRRLPVPVLGRMHRDALRLDLRCLEDEAAFAAQMEGLGS